jgi:NADH-quinone oxidoreductase subunit D
MTTEQREMDFLIPGEGLVDGPAGPGDEPVRQQAASGIELEDVETEEMLINMGPQHPATHGVLRLVLRTDGEMVLEAVPHLGYLHRCAEKIGENVSYVQYIPYTDRMDYVAGMNENWAFCRAVEKLADIEVPRRAEFIRVMIGELQRIASHLVSFGCFGMDLGAFTPFLYAFREREYILDLFEMVCGARLTYSYYTIGGVTHDLPDGYLEKVTEFLDYFEPKIPEYNNLLSYNHIFVKRTGGVAVLSQKDAIDYAVTGPVIRGSGLPYDLRRDKPYSVYPEIDFDVVVGTGEMGALGDCWDRYMIRLWEMEQCCRIIRQCIEMMPEPSDNAETGGRHKIKLPRNFKAPAGEVYLETENPRGTLGFYVESQGAKGSTVPYRVKARAGTFCNVAAIPLMCQNVLLADVPAVISSIDMVMGQVDR